MVVTIIGPEGSSTDPTKHKVILADHATPASGTWEIVLNPKQTIPERWSFTYVGETAGPADINLAVAQGSFIWEKTFRGCTIPGSDNTNFENFKKALAAWNSYATDMSPYLWDNDADGDNTAKWPNAAATMTQIRCKILDVTFTEMTPDQKTFDLRVRRVTV